MSEISPSSQNLDRYLKQIEKHEKSKVRRKRIGFLIAFLVFAGAGVLAWRLVQTDTPEPEVLAANYQELNITKVADFFKREGNTLIINYPFGVKADTVKSLEQYLEIIAEDESYNQYAATQERVNAMSLSADDQAGDNSNLLETVTFFVGGNWVEDRALVFAISQYDSAFTYEFDFGNGVQREVQESATRFTYWRAGRFTVRLTVTDSLGNAVTREKSLNIASVTDSVQEPAQAYAARTTQKQEVPVEAEPQSTPATISESVQEEATEPSENQPEQQANEFQEPTLPPSQMATNENANTLNTTQPQETLRFPEPEVEEKQAPEPEETQSTVKNIDFSRDGRALMSVEVSPTFPGGGNGLARYFGRRMRYPQQALKSKIEGRVIVRFIIDKNGQIKNPKVVSGIGYGCDEEALRLISEMPEWRPGQQGGEKVDVYQQLAIKFELK